MLGVLYKADHKAICEGWHFTHICNTLEWHHRSTGRSRIGPQN